MKEMALTGSGEPDRRGEKGMRKRADYPLNLLRDIPVGQILSDDQIKGLEYVLGQLTEREQMVLEYRYVKGILKWENTLSVSFRLWVSVSFLSMTTMTAKGKGRSQIP